MGVDNSAWGISTRASQGGRLIIVPKHLHPGGARAHAQALREKEEEEEKEGLEDLGGFIWALVEASN